MTPRDLPPRVPVTVLRVFEPLEAFPPAVRRTLVAVARDPSASRRAAEAERREAWRRVLGRPQGDGPARAHVLRVEGTVLFSPVLGEPCADAQPDGAASDRSRTGSGERVSGASGSSPTGQPVEHGSTAHPVEQGPTAHPVEQRSVEKGPVGPESVGPVPAGGFPVPPRRHSLVRAWELPVSWLAIVKAEDTTTSGGPGRYVLPMARARARAARALRTLRTSLGDQTVTLDAEGLARWLEAFHPRSWVEVDARSVAALVDGDDGADDVRLGLESLTAGETEVVAAVYRRLRRRSRRLADLALSS